MKNTKYGYWIPNKNLLLKDFLPRSQDIINLMDLAKQQPHMSQNALGISSDVYTIAVIGDSFVWGQGVKNEDTLSIQLGKELNRIKKTKVLSLSLSGDSALDNLQKYKIASKVYPINLYIFFLVENDIALNEQARYGDEEYNNIISECKQKHQVEPIFFRDNTILDTNNLQQIQEYGDNVFESFNNDTNLCVLHYISQQYPKTNAIYFITDDYLDNRTGFKILKNSLESEGLYVLSANAAKSYPKYQQYWSDPFHYFSVSPLDPHPSALAHKMYADVLFNEITSNSSWGFTTE